MMKKVFILFLSVCINLSFGQNIKEETLKAFPMAYGAGSNTSGGRGGDLIIINTNDRNTPLAHNLATSTTDEHYTGGLYAALQHPNPAYIIFDRSMTITLGIGGTGGDFTFDGIPEVNNKTIFGQSAPEGGITITGGTFRFNGRKGDNNNLILRYIKSRPILNRDGILDTGDDSYTWALLLTGGDGWIVDHCSFSFAQDKALGAGIDQNVVTDRGSSSGNYTFSNNLIEDSHTGYYFEINPNRPLDPENEIDNISIIKNVAASVNRTPNIAYSGKGEIINNIAHNTPTKNVTVYHDLKLNHIGNYYSQQRPLRDGNNTDGWNRVRPGLDDNSGNPLIYSKSNYFHGILTGDDSEDNTFIWQEGILEDSTPPASSQYFTNSIHNHNFPNPYTPVMASEAFKELITNKNVGAAHYLDNNGNVTFYLDDYDLSQLEYIANDDPSYRAHQKENWVLPNMPENIRPLDYDTDKDGMADAWEIRVFGDLSESYNGDCDGDGYTNIEEYYNQVDYGNTLRSCQDVITNIDPFIIHDKTDIKLYPIPSKNGNFQVDLGNEYEKVVMSIYGINGLLLSQTKTKNTRNFNVSNLNLKPGIYIVRFLLNNGRQSLKKLVVE